MLFIVCVFYNCVQIFVQVDLMFYNIDIISSAKIQSNKWAIITLRFQSMISAWQNEIKLLLFDVYSQKLYYMYWWRHIQNLMWWFEQWIRKNLQVWPQRFEGFRIMVGSFSSSRSNLINLTAYKYDLLDCEILCLVVYTPTSNFCPQAWKV